MSQLFGVVGSPVKHSRSPQMQQAAFDALGLDARYERFEIEPESLESGLADLVDRGVSGFNVTLPHKRAMLAWVDEVDPTAKAIGAINTVYRRDGRWIGTNTDASGLRRSLEEAGVPLAGARAVILGAGGAARAAVRAFHDAGASTMVVARRFDRADALADELGGLASDWSRLGVACEQTDVLVQATSASMGEDAASFASSLPLQRLPSDAWVVDLVYVPRRTPLLDRAEKMQLGTVDGTGMLIHQGAAAFELWTEKEAPIEVMRAALLATL